MKETKEFQTESKELLNLMINSIYTNKEIFLRELVSNASDAIDKHKFIALTSDGKVSTNDYLIRIALNKKDRTITISDNGIGMSKEDLINNLGTIAKSGSKDFVTKFKEAKSKKDFNIIGQFGVGFYSAFMVANKVEVLTKSIDNDAYLFSSNGQDSYTIEDAKKDEVGTQITLYLNKDIKEENYETYLEEWTIKDLIKKYSDYVRYPIKMLCKKSEQDKDDKGEPIEGKYHDVIEDETLNSMIPLWKKNKKDVTDKDLNDFYKSKFQDYEDPDISINLAIDGKVTYNALLFIPSHAPYNLYSDTYEKGLQLYSKGIFIKDKCPELIPDYLKFVKGLVDSESFSLNISREMLQHSPILQKIAENIEKKIIDKLKDVKEHEEEKYLKIWANFGEHIKYGIYSTYGSNKELLQDTLIFHSLLKDKYISLKEYVDNLKKDQKAIYFVSGDNLDAIKMLPQIEKYRKNEIDVLLLDQKIDEFALMMMRDYNKVEFKSITGETTDDLSKEEKEKVETTTADHKRLMDNLKEALKDKVDDVTVSAKLVDSPVCISTKEGMSLGMEKTLNEQPGQNEKVKASKVLELNPDHDIFKAFASIESNDELVKNYASILYDEAMLLEGCEIQNKTEFVKKINELMVKAFK